MPRDRELGSGLREVAVTFCAVGMIEYQAAEIHREAVDVEDEGAVNARGATRGDREGTNVAHEVANAAREGVKWDHAGTIPVREPANGVLEDTSGDLEDTSRDLEDTSRGHDDTNGVREPRMAFSKARTQAVRARADLRES